MSRREIGFRRHLRELVPGTHQLAIVAPENAVAHRRAQFHGDAAAQLDGEIGDAAPGVQLVGADDGAGGAGIDAPAAAAAVRGSRRVDRQRQVGVQLAEEKIRTGALVEQHGVLADPAQPGVARQRLFQHRRGIDVGAIAEIPDHAADPFGQFLQAIAHQLVVVAAQRVARHVSGIAVAQHLPRVCGAGRGVIHAHGDDALRAGLKLRRAGAPGTVPGHVFHLAVPLGFQPALQVLFVIDEFHAADAGVGEAEFARPALDVRGEGGVVGCFGRERHGHPHSLNAAL